MWIKIIVTISLLLCSSACSSTPTPNLPAPQRVVATFWTAEIVGMLFNVDGCLRLENPTVNYTVVFPPEYTIKIDDETVFIVSGNATGNVRKTTLSFGERVRFGGGETTVLDASLAQHIPATCPAPFWVVGATIYPLTE